MSEDNSGRRVTNSLLSAASFSFEDSALLPVALNDEEPSLFGKFINVISTQK